MKTVVLRCGDDQFIVFPSETHHVPSEIRKRKSLRSESNFSSDLFFGWDVRGNWRLFSVTIQQSGSLLVEGGTDESSVLVRTGDCIQTSAIIQIKRSKSEFYFG